jgi:hypothetical protein
MIQKLFEDSIRMSIFTTIKTNNPVIDTLLSTIILTCISYVVKIMIDFDYNVFFINLQKIKFLFYKKNVIILEGKTFSSCNSFSSPTLSSVFGDKFKAIWKEIIHSINTNKSIYEIKDIFSNDYNDTNSIYIVSQSKEFIFNEKLQIYAKTTISTETAPESSKIIKSNTKMNTIEITLYSYKSSLNDIKMHIDELTNKYITNIEQLRQRQKFIYTLIKTVYDDDCKYDCWRESILDNTKTFNNIFFENKLNILNKIDFFINNKDWYSKMGISYTLGIGLHGEPGTGKTSFIKALAKYTNRHIIVLSLKLIKTRQQLFNFFVENTYNSQNMKQSITFFEKIIVIEDIDAQGDIVLDRSKNNDINLFKNITEKSNVGEVIQNIINHDKHTDSKILSTCMSPLTDDKITLDDILNLWDGIEEHTGRILIISSNHYNKLDPALIRPGRIDITLEMKKTSHPIIKEIYEHFYEEPINLELLTQIKEYYYSPAELINLYILHKNEPSLFITKLINSYNFLYNNN